MTNAKLQLNEDGLNTLVSDESRYKSFYEGLNERQREVFEMIANLYSTLEKAIEDFDSRLRSGPYMFQIPRNIERNLEDARSIKEKVDALKKQGFDPLEYYQKQIKKGTPAQ